MPYTEEDFARMDTDPEFARRYFWTCAMKAKQRALKAKALPHKSYDEVRDMEFEERFANLLLDNLDRLVASVT